MADISQIKTLDGTTYTIKDATARQSIPTKTSDLTNDSAFVSAAFVGTSLVLLNRDELDQFASGQSF